LKMRRRSPLIMALPGRGRSFAAQVVRQEASADIDYM
jgi:hypothetical protein